MPAKRLGIVGCGNMGLALLRGVEGNRVLSEQYTLAATARKREHCPLPDAGYFASAALLVQASDYIILAVKPAQVPDVLRSMLAELTPDKVVISIAAGLQWKKLRDYAEGRAPIARVMPNTPARVGKGVFGLCFDDPSLTEGQQKDIRVLFAGLGSTYVLPEEKFNAFSAVAGCGPAYVFYMLDSMVEAAVTLGFKRPEALALALETFGGSIALAAESGKMPGALREEVCSPGGMTVAGTNYLDLHAVRGHIIECILAAKMRGDELA